MWHSITRGICISQETHTLEQIKATHKISVSKVNYNYLLLECHYYKIEHHHCSSLTDFDHSNALIFLFQNSNYTEITNIQFQYCKDSAPLLPKQNCKSIKAVHN